MHRFFHENGFNWISTPIITTSDAEGAGQMFRVSTLDMVNLPRDEKGAIDFSRDFFGKETFLTVSGQLNVEAYCLALSKATPSARPSAPRTATPPPPGGVLMIEPEIAFADLAEDARLAEEFLKYLFRAVLNERSDDLAFIAERVDKNAITKLEDFINAPFERIDYTDAVSLLQKSGRKFDFPVEWGLDLQTEHERWLTEEHVGRPVVVTNYPEHIKAFYAPERRRQDRCRDGRAGPGHRRDHRRQPARRAPGRAGRAWPSRPGSRALQLVPRFPPLWFGAHAGFGLASNAWYTLLVPTSARCDPYRVRRAARTLSPTRPRRYRPHDPVLRPLFRRRCSGRVQCLRDLLAADPGASRDRHPAPRAAAAPSQARCPAWLLRRDYRQQPDRSRPGWRHRPGYRC